MGENALYLGDKIYNKGLIGIALSGNIEIDTIVAALEDKLGETWDEFRTSTGAFGGFDADAQVRRNDAWRGTERTRTFVLQKCEFHGL